MSENLTRRTLTPDECRAAAPALLPAGSGDVWVYRYQHSAHDWTLSIATHAAPGSRKLSLGGFRIAPAERTDRPDFDTDREAIGLAVGMEGKVHWSRLIGVGGPLALRDSSRMVGGKCVLRPTPDARVGMPRDAELLDFAIACFRDFEQTAGAFLTTGQDLGHGVMSDGHTPSLVYLNERFKGSVLADTSRPTGEGNYRLLVGVLRALDVPLRGARVGLIGCGNIGEHVLGRLLDAGASPLVLEANASKREMVAARGVPVWEPARKEAFLREPMDALVVNANGGTLDSAAVRLIAANPALRVVCGCENLAMPDPRGAEVLRAAGKIYCPTELGGMMGYLTAAEEYLTHLEGASFDVATLIAGAERLEVAGYEAATHIREQDFALSFEQAVERLYGAAVLDGA